MPKYTKHIDAREQQTPAYALTGDARRAIDLTYQRAESLRTALPPGVKVMTTAIIPIRNKYVSGLNVAGNLKTLVGDEAIRLFKNSRARALTRLKNRNIEGETAYG